MRARLIAAVAIAVFAFGCGKEEKAPEPAVAENEPASAESAAVKPASAANAVLAPCGPATAGGYCGVTFGTSTPEEASATVPVKLERYDGDVDPVSDPKACFELIAAEPAEGVTFLAEGGRIGRMDVLAEGVKTADGFGVGSKAEEIRALHGAALSEGPNKYEPEVIELTLKQDPGKIVYEIQDGTVRAWRAGVAPTIDYVERCG